MSQTRPKLEQVEFRSSRTGTHSLDTYLESAEFGDRTIPDLLNDIFEFRVDPSTYALQTRRGVYLNQNSNWVDVPSGYFFRPRGTWAAGTDYQVHDLFLYQSSLFMVIEAHTSASGGPVANQVMTLINGVAGRIPVEDAELVGNKLKFLQVRPGEDGYQLVNSAAKPAFFGFRLSADETELELVYGTSDDYRPSDFDGWAVLDIGFTFGIRNNELVNVL